MSNSDLGNGAHILVIPFPAPGHIIPFLDLTHLFLTRGLTVTIVVTPSRLHLLDPLLSCHLSTSLQPLVLSPPDVPTTAPIRPLAQMRALGELDIPITQWFRSHHSPPVAIVSDLLLGWTHQLAFDLGVPRVVFWCSGALAASVFHCLWRDLPKVSDPDDEDSLLSLPEVPNCPKYPWWQMTHIHRSFEEGDPDWEFLRNGMVANSKGWAAVFNSFTELERVYIDYIKREMGHDRVWAVGPLFPSDDDLMRSTKRGGSSSVPTQEVVSWLDSKAHGSVVYVCFGSRWMLASQQVDALAAALECSRVNFIWVVKESDLIPDGFEDRVEGRGFVIKGWAPQVAILRHRAVGVFVTHCGWNSVLEGIAAGVVMLTWPIGAEQFINAKLLVDQLGVAVTFCDAGTRIVPDSAELARLLDESVGGRRAERERVTELKNKASEALKGGSSSRDMDELVKQLRELPHKTNVEPDNIYKI